MGIQINGVTDSISAVDGSLSLTGAELASVGGINVSGVVTATTYIVGSGSTSAPSISPSGDSNTGIFFPSADTIAFGEGGTEILRVTSSGTVGVNTTAINSQLEVHSAASKINTVTIKTSAGASGYAGLAFMAGQPTAGREKAAIYFQETNGGAHYTGDLVFALNSNSGSATQVSTSDERVRITSSGNLGIGTTNPSGPLHVSQSANTTGTSVIENTNTGTSASAALRFKNTGSTLAFAGLCGANRTTYATIGSNVAVACYTDNVAGATVLVDAAGPITFATNAQERARIDSSGRLLVGTSTARSAITGPTSPFLQVESTAYNNSAIIITNNENNANESTLCLAKSRGTSANSTTVVANNDVLGAIQFMGADGSTLRQAANIYAQVDATPGASDMPGRLVFSTTADGASSPTERIRINNKGYFKATATGNYYGVSVDYHELRTANSDWATVFSNSHASNPYGILVAYTATPNGTDNYFFYAVDGTTLRAQIRSNGGLANYSANNANLSDRNAKKDITPAAGTWDCIKEWEIVNYRYKDQPDDADLNLGVIAQQVAESCPEVITVFEEAKEATEDQPAQEERLGVKEQQMYWMAIKALQEAQERIEALETENSTLKSQNDSILARLNAAGI